MIFKKIKKKLSLVVLSALMLGCATAANQLEKAQESWNKGHYKAAIDYGVRSYELAMEKNKKPEESMAARDFLETYFNQANSRLVDLATDAVNSSEFSVKSQSYKQWQDIVDMNNNVKRSIAGEFLTTEDFSNELTDSKEVSAEAYYDRGLLLLESTTRDSYIEAYNMFANAQKIIPNFLDSASKMDYAKDLATVTFAIISRGIRYNERVYGVISDFPNYERDYEDYITNFIETKDKFTSIIYTYDIASARAQGADIAIEILGSVVIESRKQQQRTYVEYSRSVSANPSILVTNLNNGLRGQNYSDYKFNQNVRININLPIEFRSEPLPQVYFDRLNSVQWNNDMLNRAVSNFENSSFAEFDFYGIYDFDHFVPISNANVANIGERTLSRINYDTLMKFMSEAGLENRFLSFEDHSSITNISGSIHSAIVMNSASELLASNSPAYSVLTSEF